VADYVPVWVAAFIPDSVAGISRNTHHDVKTEIRPIGGGSYKVEIGPLVASPSANGERVRIRTDVPGAETVDVPIRVIPAM
jgi:hypothetical protein